MFLLLGVSIPLNPFKIPPIRRWRRSAETFSFLPLRSFRGTAAFLAGNSPKCLRKKASEPVTFESLAWISLKKYASF
jgi:hypothetical protein